MALQHRDAPRWSTRVFGWLLAISMVAWAGNHSASMDLTRALLILVVASLLSEAVVSLINRIWDAVELSRARDASSPQATH